MWDPLDPLGRPDIRRLAASRRQSGESANPGTDIAERRGQVMDYTVDWNHPRLALVGRHRRSIEELHEAAQEACLRYEKLRKNKEDDVPYTVQCLGERLQDVQKHLFAACGSVDKLGRIYPESGVLRSTLDGCLRYMETYKRPLSVQRVDRLGREGKFWIDEQGDKFDNLMTKLATLLEDFQRWRGRLSARRDLRQSGGGVRCEHCGKVSPVGRYWWEAYTTRDNFDQNRWDGVGETRKLVSSRKTHVLTNSESNNKLMRLLLRTTMMIKLGSLYYRT